MQQFIDFSLRHWELWLAFFIVLGILIAIELYSKLSGVRQLSHHETTLLINRQDAVVLDIRDANNYAKGHIVGAISIPYEELSAKLDKLAKYKDKPIIIVYSVGQPLPKVGSLLKQNGYTKVNAIKGGIATWQNAGLPLVKS